LKRGEGRIDKAKWTILTYIAAHNNLDELGQRSLSQITHTGRSPDVRAVVLFDGTQAAARGVAGGASAPTALEPPAT